MTVGLCWVLCLAAIAEAQAEGEALDPWVGKYCMSLFTKTRTAKTVGKDHWSVALKVQPFDWDKVRQADGSYADRPAGQSKEQLNSTLCFKYGWAEDHHIAVGIPYLANDYDLPGKTNDNDGLGNIYVFEKWNCVKETNTRPAVAVDLWYYVPRGNSASAKGLGINDGAYKVTAEVSKAWKAFSLHFNPGYTWGDDDDYEVGELNGAVILTPTKTLWPAVEYNYYWREGKGHRHDVVPGLIWKFLPSSSFKVALPITVDSSFTDKEEVGLMFKLFYRH